MKKIIPYIKQIFLKANKYYLTAIIFVVLTFVVGDSNLYQRYKYDKQINLLEKEIAHYKKEMVENKEKLEALNSDTESLTRFAREEYLMTAPDEELFIIK